MNMPSVPWWLTSRGGGGLSTSALLLCSSGGGGGGEPQWRRLHAGQGGGRGISSSLARVLGAPPSAGP